MKRSIKDLTENQRNKIRSMNFTDYCEIVNQTKWQAYFNGVKQTIRIMLSNQKEFDATK